LTSQPVARRASQCELTERQVEVLLAIAANANLSYAEQARKMGIAEDTFRNHIRAIFEKLEASNLTFAILRAIQLGIIPPSFLGLPRP
jgi:DNA-binding CsgD family transcriptional regulator